MRKRKLISLDKNIFKMLNFSTSNKSVKEAALDGLDLLTFCIKWKEIVAILFSLCLILPCISVPIFYKNIGFSDLSLSLKGILLYIKKRATSLHLILNIVKSIDSFQNTSPFAKNVIVFKKYSAIKKLTDQYQRKKEKVELLLFSLCTNTPVEQMILNLSLKKKKKFKNW